MEEGHRDDSGDVPAELESDIDIIEGYRLGKLTALSVIVSTRNRPHSVLFRCDCGKKVQISIKKIRQGRYRDACKSCYRPEKIPKKRGPKTDGLTKKFHGEYVAWRHIRGRASGLWRTKFAKFLKDMGPKPNDIDVQVLRYDLTKPYSPSNCYWGPRNRDKVKDPFIYHGEPHPPSWVVRTFGIRREFVIACRKRGITDVEQIVKLWEAHESHPEG